MELTLSLLFGLALFISVLTIVSFARAMLESAINKEDTSYGASVIVLIVSTIFWSTYHYLKLIG